MSRNSRPRSFRSVIAALGTAVAASVIVTPAPSTGTAFCSGDGSGTACPCNNSGFPGGGCSNSSFPGAILSGVGTASLSNDTLQLNCVLLPFDAAATGLLFQGTAQEAGGSGVIMGSGLRCVGGSIRRLGMKSLASGGLQFGQPVGDIPLHTRGQITVASTVHYQIWFRDNAFTGCAAPNFNYSNGLSVTWTP
jgi:hypothetical protein